jgi:3'(2'), 5'-bisphosphate nucleotidase
MDRLIQQLSQFARLAGERIMPFYRKTLAVKSKEDRSPLTEADMASHHYLVEALKDVLPNTPVISEESQNHTDLAGVSQFWLVDPLDGTKEFLKGTNEFTVNIALIRNSYPVLGVVHAPALAVTYYAASGEGAWRQIADQPSARIQTRSADSANLSIVASKDHAGPFVKTLLEMFPNATLRSMGSSLKFCLVAEGAADLYLRDLPTMEWDTAAAQCVVESAGGRVFSLDAERLSYGKDGLRNPAIMTVGDATLPLPMTRLCAAS